MESIRSYGRRPALFRTKTHVLPSGLQPYSQVQQVGTWQYSRSLIRQTSVKHLFGIPLLRLPPPPPTIGYTPAGQAAQYRGAPNFREPLSLGLRTIAHLLVPRRLTTVHKNPAECCSLTVNENTQSRAFGVQPVCTQPAG